MFIAAAKWGLVILVRCCCPGAGGFMSEWFRGRRLILRIRRGTEIGARWSTCSTGSSRIHISGRRFLFPIWWGRLCSPETGGRKDSGSRFALGLSRRGSVLRFTAFLTSRPIDLVTSMSTARYCLRGSSRARGAGFTERVVSRSWSERRTPRGGFGLTLSLGRRFCRRRRSSR